MAAEKKATLEQVLVAVQGLGEQVKSLDERVGKLDRKANAQGKRLRRMETKLNLLDSLVMEHDIASARGRAAIDVP